MFVISKSRKTYILRAKEKREQIDNLNKIDEKFTKTIRRHCSLSHVHR